MSLEREVSQSEPPEDIELLTPSKRLKLNSSSLSSAVRFNNSGNQNGSIVLYRALETNSTPVTMDELVRSPAIVLTIGPEQVQTTVQASLFRGISEPLDRLLNHTYANPGTIKEVLKHDDENAFLALVSMAYGVVLRGQGPGALTMASNSSNINSSDNGVKKLTKCPDCKKSPIKLILTCASCNPKITEEDTFGLHTFFQLQFAQQGSLTIPTRAGVMPLTGLDTKDKVTGKRHSLVHFAKVFALATKYEVWGLQYSAVRAFDKRLKKYASDDEKVVDEILETLKYLASAMPGTSGNAITPTTDASFEAQASSIDGNFNNSAFAIVPTMLLRRLLQYIIGHVEMLLKEEEFRDIVVEHGVIGLELMHVLKESIASFNG